MKFRGRLSYKLFNPTKRARFGIKFYKLCESKSGYCIGFKIYTGQDQEDKNLSASENVVLDLSKPILDKGYTLYLDSWFTSPELYLKLSEKKTNVVGTVRPDKKHFPKELKSVNLKKGDTKIKSCKSLLALKWKDRRDVYMLSSKHVNEKIINTGKIIKIKKKQKQEEVPKQKK